MTGSASKGVMKNANKDKCDVPMIDNKIEMNTNKNINKLEESDVVDSNKHNPLSKNSMIIDIYAHDGLSQKHEKI